MSDTFEVRITEDVIKFQSMLIPSRFLRERMEQFQATFHLRTPSNETWEVLVKAGLGVSIIDKGLSEFMDYHKVELNYKLIFTFNPPYEFKVVIINSGGREIYYPKRTQEHNIGLTNVYQNTMHANLNTDVHENELIRNCLNDLYYHVDHLESQNHVNPSQWSFKFVCKNYDWKYKVVAVVVDETDGNLYCTDGVDELIKYYKLKASYVSYFTSSIQEHNSNPDAEPLPTQSNFVSVMNTADWKYKVNIPIEFAKTFLGLNGRLVHIQVPGVRKQFQVQYVTRFSQEGVFKKARFEKGWRAFVQENQLGKDDEVEFTLTVADDYRIEFQTKLQGQRACYSFG
ncbi:B3 domain-containing protein Os03g0622200-like [Hevea brasiliensis]|uniref:B3 domain-containing protein Os03g0622200-like n=1 Tax=Hevea brasiliensis TaxID=3981 RepID=UPI0025D5BA7C|nr:B3 domain-containing protein Os03g0622200-like [Hevea brasiliensis]